MRRFLSTFRRDETGVTLLEHGIALILALVVGAAGLTLLGGGVTSPFGKADACIATDRDC